MARSFALALALALAVAAPVAALAGIPAPINYIVPDYITVVGHNGGGAPDPAGQFEIILRDLANNPIAGAWVALEFAACTDVRICQTQPAPGTVVDCTPGAPRLLALSDANGRVVFDIVGQGMNAGASPGPGLGCMAVVVGGVVAKWVTVAVLDQNGGVSAPGVEITDLTAWLKDLGSGNYYGRSDYNRNGVLDVVDFVVLLRALGAGSSSAGCATLVPPGVCN